VAAGRKGTPTVRRAVRFLARRQNPDGGYPLQPGGPSNAQSTSWAIQALVAAGRDPGRRRRHGTKSPLAYLRSLTTPSGMVRYSRTSAQTPVWVTAQAVAALARRPFPLEPVPRAKRAATPTRGAGEESPLPATTRAPAAGSKARVPKARPPATAADFGPPTPRDAAMWSAAHAAGYVTGLLVAPVA
jgi:hypothetical protein